MRIAFQALRDEFYRVLERLEIEPDRAALVARLFTENQRDGVHSHGLNRFPGFVADIQKKQIDIRADPQKVGGLGGFEQWDGKRGIGLWNAHFAMGRAVAAAGTHGIGCVGLRNTNHWMRGGAYALQAADAGCMGICWTNTIPLMPPWGSAQVRTGNNPMAFALPRKDGHLLMDMAVSQFSNGKLEVLRRQGKQLPLAGGFDGEGRLTVDPGAILESRRALPIGYWKGTALAVILDSAATLVSGGMSSHQIGLQGVEHGVSQVFIAINVTALGGEEALNQAANAIVDDLHTAQPLTEGEKVRYPGEGMLRIRQESMKIGVWVDDGQFKALQALMA